MYGLRVNIGSQYLVSKSGLKILSPHLGCFQYLVTWGLACFLLASSSRLLARASSPLTPSSKLACSEISILFASVSGVNKVIFWQCLKTDNFCRQLACGRAVVHMVFLSKASSSDDTSLTASPRFLPPTTSPLPPPTRGPGDWMFPSQSSPPPNSHQNQNGHD